MRSVCQPSNIFLNPWGMDNPMDPPMGHGWFLDGFIDVLSNFASPKRRRKSKRQRERRNKKERRRRMRRKGQRRCFWKTLWCEQCVNVTPGKTQRKGRKHVQSENPQCLATRNFVTAPILETNWAWLGVSLWFPRCSSCFQNTRPKSELSEATKRFVS